MTFAGILASDSERTAVVTRLQDAATEGRLTLGELSYRASRAYAARTWAELDRLTWDLPVLPVDPPPPAKPRISSRTLARTALWVGVGSIPLALFGSVGALVGLIGVLIGVLALCSPDGQQPHNRRLAIAGILWSLSVPTVLVTIPLLLGTSLS